MACFRPNRSFIGPKRSDGKVNVVWKRPNTKRQEELYLPCGKCVGCKEETARQWMSRIMHEAEMYEQNAFITLTYNEENLPKDGSLKLEHYQLFQRRLRKLEGRQVRYYHVGEYGSKYKRPHYHSILFNYDFDDKVLFSEKDGKRLYTSEKLASLWPLGNHLIGDVTYGSASYVARYVLKKIKGEARIEGDNRRKPEYSTMSRRPGIGYEYFKKYKDDIYPSDSIIVQGVECRPPRFYDNHLDKVDHMTYKRIKGRRYIKGHKGELVWHKGRKVLVGPTDMKRLLAKEKCKEAQMKLKDQRKLERVI